MNTLIIFDRPPNDGTGVAWNGLQWAGQALKLEIEVRIFLLNDSVDLVREVSKSRVGYFDLQKRWG